MVKNFVINRVKTRNTSKPVKNSYLDRCCGHILGENNAKGTRTRVPTISGLGSVMM